MPAKHTNQLRFRFFGNEQKAQQLTGQARKFMGVLKEAMSFRKLKFLSDEYRDGEGNIYRCQSNQNGLSPIDEVAIYAVGGVEMDVCTGFIARAKNNSTGAYTNVKLSVKWLDDEEAAAVVASPFATEYIDYVVPMGMTWFDELGADLIHPPDSNTYWRERSDYYFAYDGVFTAITPFPTTSSIEFSEAIATVYQQSVMDKIMELPYIPATEENLQISAVTWIRQASEPRVRFFGSDYVLENGIITIVESGNFLPQKLNTCCAVLLPKMRYKSSVFVDADSTGVYTFSYQDLYDTFYNDAIWSDIYNWWLAYGYLAVHGDANAVLYTVTASNGDFVANSTWEMSNKTTGRYEISILEYAGDAVDTEVDILLFGTKYPKKIKFPNFWKSKLIISVNQPAVYDKNKPNPHLRITPLL